METSLTPRGALHKVWVMATKPHANWLAWIMQGIFGLFVGALGGFAVIARRRAGFWLDDKLILPFLIGAALIGAGLGSRYGDRLWLRDNYGMLPPEEPEQSNLSDILSWCSFGAGLATCIVAILKQLRVL
jgi:hypothetical protein